MKNLLTISQDEFRASLPGCTTGTLKNLIEVIYEFKSSHKFTGDEEIFDIERKETKIWAELMRRSYLVKGEYKDFHEWLRKLRHKKVIF